MVMGKISDLVRPNIKNLKPYSSARDEYTGKIGVFLDANENSLGSVSEEKNNRYPDPYQYNVKNRLSEILEVKPKNMFLGNGSDEAIDLLIRIFCKPGQDEILILPPTYGMYKVAADINNIAVSEVPLDESFDLDVEKILEAVKPNTKIIFICSPNNPTGNMMSYGRTKKIVENFDGIVVVDEAYIDFSECELNKRDIQNKGVDAYADPVTNDSMLHFFETYPNLVVLRTFSKAWGMANIRLGMAFGNEELIQYMNNVKPPYNVNGVSQEIALEALKNLDKKNQMIEEIVDGRYAIRNSLGSLPFVEQIYPSDANFIMVKFTDSAKVFQYLLDKKIIVRDRSSQPGCENCLRITVGTKEENNKLINALTELI